MVVLRITVYWQWKEFWGLPSPSANTNFYNWPGIILLAETHLLFSFKELKRPICFLFLESSHPPTKWRVCSEQPMIMYVQMEQEHLFHHCQVWPMMEEEQWPLRDNASDTTDSTRGFCQGKAVPWPHIGEKPVQCHQATLHMGKATSQKTLVMFAIRPLILNWAKSY